MPNNPKNSKYDVSEYLRQIQKYLESKGMKTYTVHDLPKELYDRSKHHSAAKMGMLKSSTNRIIKNSKCKVWQINETMLIKPRKVRM